MKLAAKIGFAAISIIYPFAVYFGARYFSVRYLVLMLVCVAAFRLLGAQTLKGFTLVAWLLVVAVLAGLSLWTNTDMGLQLYPVAINVSLLAMFAGSLWQSQTVVERLARLKNPNLPVQAIAYTRTVTKVWSVFFMANGMLAAWTVWYGDRDLWLLYNGFIAYLLIGLLVLVEWLIRQRVQARIQRGDVQ